MKVKINLCILLISLEFFITFIYCEDLLFKGNKLYNNKKLLSIIKNEWENYLKTKDISYIDDASYKIEKFYKNLGHCFVKVEYDIISNKVIFNIKEYNSIILKKVEILSWDSKKRLSYPLKKLEKFLTKGPLFGKHYFKKSEVVSDAVAIKNFYITQGYYKVKYKIKYKYSPNPPYSKEVKVKIFIKEGPRSYFNKIIFLGNKYIKSNKLLEILKIKNTKKILKNNYLSIFLLKKEQILIPRKHYKFAKILKRYYKNKGFARVKIKPILLKNIGELKNIDNILLKLKKEEISSRLSKFLKKYINYIKYLKIYSYNSYFLLKDKRNNKILFFIVVSKNRLSIYFKSHPSIILSKKQKKKKEFWSILLYIQEGEINYINKIYIKGNELTKDYVIYNLLEISEGDKYNLNKIRKSERNLQDTDLFIWVEIQEKLLENNKIDLIIVVKEAEDKILTFSIGYSTTYLGMLGIGFEMNNLFGTGRKLHLNLEGSFYRTSGSIKFIEPWTFNIKTLRTQLEGFIIYDKTNPSFDELDRGIELNFKKNITYFLSIELGYKIEWTQVLDVEDGFENVQEGTTLISSTTQKIVLDLRDDRSYPTSGTYTFVELEQSLKALGAEIDYSKIYVHSAWYFDIYKSIVIALAIRWGIITPFNDTDEIPLSKRYFGGGANSVRSFKEKEMPPFNEEGKPIGGEGIFIFSAELRIPIYKGFGVSSINDIGQIIPRVRNLTDYKISKNKLRYGVGASIWYNTPLGALRFDWSFNPDREENEDKWAYFISIGFSI